MTKNHKLFFWIGLGLFLIPELLWSPVFNYVYELLQLGSNDIAHLRESFLTNNQSYGFFWYGFIVAIQLVGLMMMAKTLQQLSINAKIKIFLGILLWSLVGVSVLILYFVTLFDINI